VGGGNYSNNWVPEAHWGHKKLLSLPAKALFIEGCLPSALAFAVKISSQKKIKIKT
jgi:hypothetical protein